MDDKQWDDYIRRQPGTFWGEWAKSMDEASRPKPISPVGPVVSRGRRGGSGESPFEFVWSLTDWFRERLFPLRLLSRAGERLTEDLTWKSKGPMAAIGVVVAGSMLSSGELAGVNAMLADLFGSYGPLAGLSLGAIAGWWFLPLFGALTTLSSGLVALALALTTIVFFIGLIYGVAAAIFGWPPFRPGG